MKPNIKFILIALLFSIHSHAMECADLFQVSVRTQIWNAALQDAKADKEVRPGAWASPIRGGEGPFILPEMYQGGHVISFGSGPDVYRPLHDFPYVKNFHLVDSLLGWGTGPAQVLSEIQARLKSITPEAEVQIVDRGFLKEVSQEVLADTELFYMEHVQNPDWSQKPLVLKASWKMNGENFEKFIFVHPMDYFDKASVAYIFQSQNIGKDLHGVLISGAPIPPKNIMNLVTSHMEKNAVIIAEVFKAPQTLEFYSAYAANLAKNYQDKFAVEVINGPEFNGRLFLHIMKKN